MTQETDYHGWTIPVPDDISNEDRDVWGDILVDFFDNELDIDVPIQGPIGERPSASSENQGSIWIVSDSDPIEFTRSDGSNWSTVASVDADTLDGIDSSAFAQKSQDETIDGSWTHTAEQVFDGGINGSLTDGTSLTDITGGNLFINSGELTASNMRTDVSDDGTEVVSNTTSLNFGSGLSVTDPGDGSATIDNSRTTTTLYMSDYAPSGGLCDTEFDSAISDASPGDTIVFDANDYELNTSHTINKTLTIDSTPEVVVSCTNTSNNNPHIHFQGGGIQNNTTTTSEVRQGDRVIPVNDTSVFSVDDRVLLMEDEHASQVDTKIHFDKVESVDSGNSEISLFGGTYKEFSSGTYVYQVDLLERPLIKDIETDGGGTRHLQFQWCEDPKFKDTSVSEYLEISLYALECWKPKYENVEATDPEGLGSGEGEPIALYRSTDGYIEAPRVYDCRRGIDFAWGAHTHAVVDPVIRGVSLNGISVHQDNQSGSLLVTGGEIVCDPNGQTGNGITGSSSTKLYIDGIRIVAREHGIICNGQTRITNVTVTPTEGNTSSSVTSGFNIKYGDTSVRDSYVDDPDGAFDFGVWVDGGGSSNVKHIVIDCEITHEADQHILLDARNGGIESVKIRGFLRNINASGTSDEGIFIRADGTSTISDVDINVTAKDFPNQVVRMLSEGTEQIKDIRFHDCYFDCGAAAIYDDGTGSFGSIRVSDCNCNTGSTSLSFNDSITKLFVTNNDVTGTIDSSGASESTVTGNL